MRFDNITRIRIEIKTSVEDQEIIVSRRKISKFIEQPSDASDILVFNWNYSDIVQALRPAIDKELQEGDYSTLFIVGAGNIVKLAKSFV